MPIWGTVLLSVGTAIVGVVFTHLFTKQRNKGERRNKDSDEAFLVLRNENQELKARLELFEMVESVPQADYLLIRANGWTICHVCWGKNKTAIKVSDNGSGYFICGNCKAYGVFNAEHVKRIAAEQDVANAAVQSYLNYNG